MSLGRFLSMCLSMGTIFATSLLLAETPEEVQENEKVSEAFGHLIGKNLDTFGVKLNLKQVIKGLEDAANGKSSPMTESECIEAIAVAQEKVLQKQSQENLVKAESFLKENAKIAGVVSLEEGKIQYKVEKTGSGAKVEPNFTPIVRYMGKFLDGSVFNQSTEEEVSLEDTIPGFSKAVAGMQEGEKRTVYIHPEYAYGPKGAPSLPPNSLLTFEIEVIKASTPTNSSPLISPSSTEASFETKTPVTESLEQSLSSDRQHALR